MAQVEPAFAFDRVRELFEHAVHLPPDVRRAWLDSNVLDDDDAVRAEVQSLLESYDDAGEFLAEPGEHEADVAATLEEPPGTRVGRYTLVRRLGEGGFGDVYLAEQSNPIRRQVALKLIKPGMDSRQVLARFHAERNTLALLEHPNVARILDAGATAARRPYFAMELVGGAPITQYCDSRRLDLAQRIDLFLSVCHAVQHAHQKGVIHRDLKPANVLVAQLDGRPIVKVIDFGIAKLLMGDGAGQHTSLVTARAQRLGTPAYASPEQVEGQPVDTRSDVFSLGVMLYELLCGNLPPVVGYARGDVAPPMSRNIVEPDASAAARGLSSAAALRRTLRGELDWVVGKCLRHDPDERYAGAAALADDLEAYLAKRPVHAAPPSRIYLVRKFVRRNRLLATVVSLAVVVLLAALVATQLALGREAKALALEQQSRLAADQVNNYITQIFRQANPQLNDKWRRDYTVLEAVDYLASEIEEDAETLFKNSPLAMAALCETVAELYASIGTPEKGVELARRAVEVRRAQLGADHRETLDAEYSLASTYASLGRHADALELFGRVWDVERRAGGADRFTTLTTGHSVGVALKDLGRLDEAEVVLRDVLERKRRLPDGYSHSVAVTANVLGHLLMGRGRLDEAEALIREAYDVRRKRYGLDHPSTLGSQINVANLLVERGRLAEAHDVARDALDRALRAVGKAHDLTRGAAKTLAVVLDRQGRHDEADAVRARYPSATSQPSSNPATQPR